MQGLLGCVLWLQPWTRYAAQLQGYSAHASDPLQLQPAQVQRRGRAGAHSLPVLAAHMSKG